MDASEQDLRLRNLYTEVEWLRGFANRCPLQTQEGDRCLRAADHEEPCQAIVFVEFTSAAPDPAP